AMLPFAGAANGRLWVPYSFDHAASSISAPKARWSFGLGVSGATAVGVAHEEALAVVVGVDEPTGDAAGRAAADRAGRRVGPRRRDRGAGPASAAPTGRPHPALPIYRVTLVPRPRSEGQSHRRPRPAAGFPHIHSREGVHRGEYPSLALARTG